MPYLYKMSLIQCRGSAGCIYIENMFKSFILVDHSDLCNIVTVKEIGKKSIKTIKWNKMKEVFAVLLCPCRRNVLSVMCSLYGKINRYVCLQI